MRKNRKSLLITSVTLMAVIWAFIAIEKGTDLLKGIDLFVFILIVSIGAFAMYNAWKKDREEKAGQPAEDELSLLIKYKAGYYAYLASMYMWLFIFLLKDYFPNTETLLGGGILLSALIAFGAKMYSKNSINA